VGIQSLQEVLVVHKSLNGKDSLANSHPIRRIATLEEVIGVAVGRSM
jgi:hypothetical protein